MPTPRRSATESPARSPALPDEDPALRAESAAEIEPGADGATEGARRRCIAERAYRRAERRGFAPGQELDDWLAAEADEDEGKDAEDDR